MIIKVLMLVAGFVLAVIVSSVLVGCSSYQPAVLDDWQSPNHASLQQDYHDCQIQAQNASHNNAGEAAKGTAVGALGGGAVGAAAGAIGGDPAMGAAAGALVGITAGAFSSLYQNNAAFHAAYDDCMRYRGHKVLGR